MPKSDERKGASMNKTKHVNPSFSPERQELGYLWGRGIALHAFFRLVIADTFAVGFCREPRDSPQHSLRVGTPGLLGET